MAPAYPFAQTAVNQQLPLRQQVGLYVTGDPQFARATVNYIWREFFGRGIVEPANQFDPDRLDPARPPAGEQGLQPSHPGLLAWLAEGFRESGFDLQWLMRQIANSQIYQLSSRYDGVFNPQYERYFVRHRPRRLGAEQIHDAVLIATGQKAAYRVSRVTFENVGFAMQFPDVNDMPRDIWRNGRNDSEDVRSFLRSFLPGDRLAAPRSDTRSALQALNLMNNGFVLRQITGSSSSGTIQALLSEEDDALVTGLFLCTLGRHPTAEEITTALAYFDAGPSRQREERAEELMWALLNRAEFHTNY